MFKSRVLTSWNPSSMRFGIILGVKTCYVFGTIGGGGTAKLEKGGSAWLGHHSRYHVLHFLSFYHMILPNIRCRQCSSCISMGMCGRILHLLHVPQKGELAAALGPSLRNDSKTQLKFEVFHYIPYINKLFSQAVEAWTRK